MKKLINNFLFLKNFFQKEKNNFILWYPIFFVLGIYIKFESSFILKYILSFFLIISSFYYFFLRNKKHKKTIINFLLKQILIFLIFIILGYIRTSFVIKKYNFPVIKKYLGKCTIYGNIEKEKLTLLNDNSYKKEIVIKVDRIVLNNKNIFPKKDTPKKILVRLSNSEEQIFLGDVIVESSVFPFRDKKFESDFDLKKHYYFQEIGGLGYKGKIIKNTKNNKLNFIQIIDNFRNTLALRIINIGDKKSSSIIATLLTGQKNLADKESVNNMNYSGLSHLLAISGLHMMTLIGFIFFIVKWILLRFEIIAIKYNVFKISAFVSLLFNFLYLLLSGMSVSAIRAYIMNFILLFSLIINKFNDSLRSVTFVMLCMTFINPYAIFNVGFQLSFISVISITSVVAYYNSTRNKEKTIFSNFWLTKIYNYFITSLVVSLTAEAATTPLSIYSFNNYTFYNVFTNVFATPIVSFAVLPLSIISVFFYFFNLEYLCIRPASYLMSIVLKLSEFIVKIPNSIMFIRSPNFSSMFLMLTGILWFTLWKSKIRKFGYFIYFFGLISIFLQKQPTLIIDKEDKSIYFKQNKKEVLVYNPKMFNVYNVIKKLETDKFIDITLKYKNDKIAVFKKNNKIYKVNLKTLHFYNDNNYKIAYKNKILFIY